MSALTASDAVDAVIDAGRRAAERGWAPATAGNFSVRTGDVIAITRTGRDKGRLRPEGVALVPLSVSAGTDISAEAALHFTRYKADPRVGAVFHVHTVHAAVLARRYEQRGELIFHGWELQKALSGVTSHLTSVRLPILSNDQDMDRLAAAAELALRQLFDGVTAPGYLVAGHGLNAWGHTPEEAQRHLEALETLLSLQGRWSEVVP